MRSVLAANLGLKALSLVLAVLLWFVIAGETASEMGLRVLDGIAERDHAYFVHSFQLKASQPETVLAVVDYGGPVTAMVSRDSMAGSPLPLGADAACTCANPARLVLRNTSPISGSATR